MERLVQTDSMTIYKGNAMDWKGGEAIDLVFTNPYGPMPTSLIQHPMVIHQWAHRRRQAEEWVGTRFAYTIGEWNHKRETFWGVNMAQRITVNIEEFVPEPMGWYPEAMVERLLKVFGRPGYTIWDGFMGRGTVGKVAVEMGMKYVAVEQLPSHIAIAREYLSV